MPTQKGVQASVYHLLKIQSEGMPQERKNPFHAFIEVLWVKNTCGRGSSSQRSCSSHTGNPTPGCVSGEGCGVMGVRLDTARNPSCWGWGSCSHGAQWSTVRYSCPSTELCFSFTPRSSLSAKVVLRKKVVCVHLCQGFLCEEACLRMVPLNGGEGTAP